MSRRSLFLLLGLLVVLSSGVVWLVHGLGAVSDATGVEAASIESAAKETDNAPRATSELQAPRAPEAKSPDLVTASTEKDNREAVDALSDLDLKDALWVEGRLRFPDKTPLDEKIEVVAQGRGFEKRPLHRARVGSDGKFRVAFSPKTKKGWLHIEARYCFLAQNLPIKPSDPPQNILLEPELGGCLRGRCILGAGMDGERAKVVGTKLNLTGYLENGGSFNQNVQRVVKVDDKLEFELGGLRPNMKYWFNGRPKDLEGIERDDLEIKAGEVLALDLEMHRGVRIAGKVLDESGAGVKGATFATILKSGFGANNGSPEVKSSDDGSFALTGVKAGDLKVTAHKDGFVDAELPSQKLEEGDVREGVSLVLRLGNSISGKVQWPDGKPAAGAVVHVEIGREPEESERYFRNDAIDKKSDAGGVFTITGLRKATITLTARARRDADGKFDDAGAEAVEASTDKTSGEGEANAAGEEDADAKPDAQADKNSAAKPDAKPDAKADAKASAKADAKARKADKTKLKGPQWSARLEDVQPNTGGILLTLQAGGSVQGKVSDDTGAPIERFHVSATPVEDNDTQSRYYGRKERVAQTYKAADGRFVLEGLRDGEWDIEAAVVGSHSAKRRVKVPGGNAPLDLVVPRVATASGIVTDPAGHPVAQAIVSASSATRTMYWDNGREERSKATDKDGRFKLDNLAPGSLKISAKSEGWAESEDVKLDVAAAQEIEGLTLMLRLGGNIQGEVLDGTGHADAGRHISMWGQRGGVNHDATSDAAGRFEFDHLAPGQYELHTQPNEKEQEAAKDEKGETDWEKYNALQKQASVKVVEGETAHVVLGAMPRAPVRVFGSVTCAKQPVAGAKVNAWAMKAEGGQRQHSATSDAKGLYEMTVDEPGSYSFNVRIGGVGTQIGRTEEVPAGASFELDFELESGRILGRVIGPDGRALSGIRVTLQVERGAAERSRGSVYGQIQSDDDGRFEFGSLPASTFVIEAGGGEPWMGGGDARYGKVRRDGLVLASGGAITDVELRLARAGRVTGAAIGPSGQPVQGATIFVFDEHGRPMQGYSRTTTDASGRFDVDGLAPGRVFATARTAKLASPSNVSAEVRSGESAEVQLSLSPATVLYVVVEDANGKKVGAGISVTDEHNIEFTRMWGPNDGSESQEPAPPGQRVGPLAPGKYTVTASNHDGNKASAEVRVSGQERETVRLRLGG